MAKQPIREADHLRRDETLPEGLQRDRSPDDFPRQEGRSEEMPPEGPHASERLIDPDKTPGSGAFSERRTDGDADASTG